MVSVNSKTPSNGQTARSKIRVTDDWGGAEVAEMFGATNMSSLVHGEHGAERAQEPADGPARKPDGVAAQVVLTDRLEKLAVSVQELREVQKHTDERMSALIITVDGLIRNRPNP
jgi:hypothetical protein